MTRTYNARATFSAWCLILGLSTALPGWSKAAPPPPPVIVAVTSTGTNASGQTLVQLSLTNNSARAILIGVRSAVYRTQKTWVTNFNIRPLFTGMAGLGSQASDLSLAPGAGVTAKLTPLNLPPPFHIEFVCFPSRTGLPGLVDQTQNHLDQYRDGSPHERYLGDSFFLLSPLITARAANRSPN